MDRTSPGSLSNVGVRGEGKQDSGSERVEASESKGDALQGLDGIVAPLSNAVHELIDKGFLILQQGKTIYHFYELPSPLHMPKVGKTPAEKQESTTSNNTNNETGCGPNTPFQGVSSLPRNHTKYASMDAAGTKVPARDKAIPSIKAANLYSQQLEHNFYVKYLGDNIVQFPSGKQFRVIEDDCYDSIIVNYQWQRLGDVRQAELAKAAKPA